jgi:hypothetical protein
MLIITVDFVCYNALMIQKVMVMIPIIFVYINVLMVISVIIQQICVFFNAQPILIIMEIQLLEDVYSFVVKVSGHKMEAACVSLIVARIHMLII